MTRQSKLISRSSKIVPQAPTDINEILEKVPLESPDCTPDEFTQKEQAKYTVLCREELEQLLKFRKEYAQRFWRLTKYYLATVGIYLALSTTSIHIPLCCTRDISLQIFRPSDGVLIALLTTTTANIIAVLIVFARFLFPDGGIRKR